MIYIEITNETERKTLLQAIFASKDVHGSIQCVCGNTVAACPCHWVSKPIGLVEPCVCNAPGPGTTLPHTTKK